MLLTSCKGVGVWVLLGFCFVAAGCGQSGARKRSADELRPLAGSAPAAETAMTEGVSAGSEDGEREAEGPGARAAVGSLAGRIWSLPGLVVEDSKEIVSSRGSLFWLLAAGGGSIALRQSGADDRIDESFQRNPWISRHSDLDKFVDYAGSPATHFAATGIWYVVRAAQGDEVGMRNAWTMFEALSVNGAITLGLKLIVNDKTPNGKSLAWPSGHTSSSFTVAAVLDELYGPWVGIPAYVGAGFVGYRMMDARDHWASDVLFGAVLGYIVGHQVAQKYAAPKVAGWELVPYSDVVAGRTVTGVGFARSF